MGYSKRVSVRISDSDVWNAFSKYVECKYGKTYGMVGKELENVLKLFLDQPLVFEKMGQEQEYLEKFQNLKYKTLQIEKDKFQLLNKPS